MTYNSVESRVSLLSVTWRNFTSFNLVKSRKNRVWNVPQTTFFCSVLRFATGSPPPPPPHVGRRQSYFLLLLFTSPIVFSPNIKDKRIRGFTRFVFRPLSPTLTLELKLGKVFFHLQGAHELKVPFSTLSEMSYWQTNRFMILRIKW